MPGWIAGRDFDDIEARRPTRPPDQSPSRRLGRVGRRARKANPGSASGPTRASRSGHVGPVGVHRLVSGGREVAEEVAEEPLLGVVATLDLGIGPRWGVGGEDDVDGGVDGGVEAVAVSVSST